MNTPSIPSSRAPASSEATGTWRFRAPDHPNIVPVAAFNDNYIWLIGLADPSGVRHGLVVDPGDGAPVIRALAESGMALAGILITHHHADHTGGIAELKAEWPQARVIGPADCRHALIEERVRGGDTVAFPDLGFLARVIDVPGHTLDHIAFACDRIGTTDRPVLFCGDTLFAGGCGRLFEGTPADMIASLARLAELPRQTAVYCAHEYTLSNLRFAAAAEPDSADVAARIREAEAIRRSGTPTVPSTIAAEVATNPFLRIDAPGIAASVAGHAGEPADRIARFAALRQWKNDFRG